MEAPPTADPAHKGYGTTYDEEDGPLPRHPDYYAALGLPPDADDEAIHRAYRRLAKLWHPDRYALAPAELRARAERRMSAINRAYAVLGDSLARYVYDHDRRLAAHPYVTTGAPHGDYGPYGHAAGFAGARRGRPAGQPNHHADVPPPSAFGNPNGAGEFFGVLCLLLVLCVLGWAQRAGLDNVLITLLVIAGVLGLLALALVLFTDDSPLARLALRWAEGEPRGMAPKPSPRRPPPHAAPTGERADERADETADDPEVAAAARFERLVDEALATVPAEFAPYLANVVVRVEEAPSAETLREAGVAHGHTLLGLYHGVPLTQQGGYGAGPGVISIYRKPIERVSQNRPTRIRAQVRATVLHELAHHFGIDHDEMPTWVK
jgi:predicted Zn-dependent protease with MMP-like domain